MSLSRRLGLALALLTVGTTGHRFANDFVFDDVAVLRDGELVHDPNRLGEVWTSHTMAASAADPGVQSVDTYRPVPITTFMVDAMVSGRDPWAFHVTNLLLHLACVWLVFALGQAFGFAPWPAFYGAAIFALHPWAVEAHGWINGRSDPLALSLGLASMLLVMRGEKRNATATTDAAAALVLLLGFLSKETLLLLVPAMVCMPAPASPGLPAWRTIGRRLRWTVPPAAAYLTLRAVVLGGMRAGSDPEMLQSAAHNLPLLLFDSARQATIPTLPYLRSLRDEYASVASWERVAAIIGLVALGLAIYALRRRHPRAIFYAAWFFAPIVPVALISTALWPGFGRYLYLPLASFAWACADLATHVGKRFRPALASSLAAMHLALLAVMAAAFLAQFRDSEHLYDAAIASRPDIAMGHGFLGLHRLAESNPTAAVAPLRKAVSLAPEEHRFRLAWGRALLASGDLASAAEVAASGIDMFRGRPEEAAYHLLAVNALPASDPERAVSHMAGCLEAWPGRSDCERALRTLLTTHPDAAANRAAAERLRARHPLLNRWVAASAPR